MCTAIFIPKGNKYFFISLRDENPMREKASVPVVKANNGISVLSPADGAFAGTWAGVSSAGIVIILLNGAFKKHERKAGYRKSRGLIVSELLLVKSPVKRWRSLDLDCIEPFTLVVFERGSLYQLTWDGLHKHEQSLDTSIPRIWSSSTLYDEHAKYNREALFGQWLAKNLPVSPTKMIDFFHSCRDAQDGFIINRDDRMCTLSCSFIEYTESIAAEFFYSDLRDELQSNSSISFSAFQHEPALLTGNIKTC